MSNHKQNILETKSHGQWFYSAVLAVVIVTSAHLLYYFPRTIDDMFIYLRYAENLAKGNGLVYNPGERVEGFSSPLWVVLPALGELVGIGGVTYSKMVAIFFVVACLVGVYTLSREHFGLSRMASLMAPLMAALNSYLISWTLYGLETPAYLASIVWTAVFTHRQIKSASWGNAIGQALLLAAASLLRPEAPLLVGLIVTALVLQPLDARLISARFKCVARPVMVAVALVAIYVLFRRFYFGLWLPHPFYAKHAAHFDVRRWAAVWSQGALLSEVIFVFGAFVLAVILAISRRAMLSTAIFIGVLFFVGSVLPDWMDGNGR